MPCSKLVCPLASAALAAAAALLAVHLARGQDGAPPAGASQAADPSATDLGAPRAEHAALAARAGRWKQKHEFRFAPDAPWTKSDGSSEARAVLGGRYLVEEFRFDVMGMPVEGLQISGFDRRTGEHTSLWMDSMSTWSVASRGRAAADGTIEYRGAMLDPSSGSERPFRTVLRPDGPDAYAVEMFDTVPGGGEQRMMRFASRRE